MNEWLPIDSAPKDDDILGYWNVSKCYAVVRYFSNHETSSTGWMDESGEVSAPTHWMPLPEPPK